MNDLIYIVAARSISALGSDPDQIWANYREPRHFLRRHDEEGNWAGVIPDSVREAIRVLQASESRYRELDDSVLYGVYTARNALADAGWKNGESYGINIGSSRGATGLFERYHGEFLATGRTSALSSPTTTLGNISSWIAQDRLGEGPVISHSITCSTALHALANAMAWIRGGMADRFLAGGAEASLTPFTMAQMKALKILSRDQGPFPCRALDPDKNTNTMVLGEGAAAICLEKNPSVNPLAAVEGIGMATEQLTHNASISADAKCFQKSMVKALGGLEPEKVDVVVAHAPGTIKGDQAELLAIQKVFGKEAVSVTANKWKMGHTFGASGMHSLELAISMIDKQSYIPVPYLANREPRQIKRVMVNAVGFGGNAVSVLVAAPPGS